MLFAIGRLRCGELRLLGRAGVDHRTFEEDVVEMPGFHVFYCHHSTGDVIASHAPALMPLDRIAALASDVLEENGDFLGLVDEDDSVLQFIYLARSEDDSQPIRMEVPDVAQRQSLVKHISNAELSRLLENLPDRLTVEVISEAGLSLQGS